MKLSITIDTINESFNAINNTGVSRRNQCLAALKNFGECTANELAVKMAESGVLPYFSRNFVQPRLNELVAQGKVKVINKKFDTITNRNCAVYKLA